MSWLSADGKMSENILFSKVTYTRNISGLPFPCGSFEAVGDIISKSEAILKKNGFHSVHLTKKDASTCHSYYEKQYVDMDFCEFKHQKALFFNEPCSLCVSVGGANFINIYAILPGLSVKDAYNISSSAEQLLDSELSFAYSESFGYLSSLQSTCGSGMRISCALYLPSLSESGKMLEVSKSVGDVGMSIYPLFSCKPHGDIYIMTYSPQKDTDEYLAVEMFEQAVLGIVRLEGSEHSFLGADKISQINQRASFALGSLAYSYSLSEEQLILFTSDLRRYMTLPEKPLKYSISLAGINSLLFESLSSSVIAGSRVQISSPEELNIQRAQEVKKHMASFTEKTDVALT